MPNDITTTNTDEANTAVKFFTVSTRNQFVSPSPEGTAYPALHELIKPHIESFNALKETNSGRGKGLLELAVQDLDRRTVRDQHGNRLDCLCFNYLIIY
jgi:DNA-directed RNA polymerase I subunit RPA2